MFETAVNQLTKEEEKCIEDISPYNEIRIEKEISLLVDSLNEYCVMGLYYNPQDRIFFKRTVGLMDENSPEKVKIAQASAWILEDYIDDITVRDGDYFLNGKRLGSDRVLELIRDTAKSIHRRTDDITLINNYQAEEYIRDCFDNKVRDIDIKVNNYTMLVNDMEDLADFIRKRKDIYNENDIHDIARQINNLESLFLDIHFSPKRAHSNYIRNEAYRTSERLSKKLNEDIKV